MDKDLEALIRQFQKSFKKIEGMEEPDEEDLMDYNELLNQIEQYVLNMIFEDKDKNV